MRAPTTPACLLDAGPRRRLLGLLLAASVPVCAVATTPAEARFAKPRDVRRAVMPSKPWDKTTAKLFLDDAFGSLEGERPVFTASSSGAGGQGGPAPGEGGGQPSSGGFKWSGLISEESLTDEVKDSKATLTAAVGSPSDFKGGGYNKARVGFSSIALAFGVIAAYDQDIRWKKDAETARDLFARVAVNCKVGTEQSLAESKLRVADLEAMLDGGSPQGKPDREEDFKWSQVAGRPALMSRLENAENAIKAATASSGDFKQAADALLREAEMMAAIGEVIQQADYEYFDDDTYRGYASGMRDAAVSVREAVKKGDYEAARTATGEISKACSACHGDYRS
jgi:hypothetical protein